MATTKILFNTNDRIKEKAKKRAHKEGTDLTAILNQAMVLYADGVFDPDDFLTKEDIRAIRRAEADVKAGRVYSQQEVFKELGL
jgi:predicted transcriptional regulator